MFLLDLEAVIPRPLKGAPGVTVYVKPCTLAEADELLLASVPDVMSAEAVDRHLSLMERHVDHIAGLRVALRPGAPVPPGMRAEERDGRVIAEVRTYRDAFRTLPMWLVLEIARAVQEASNLTPAQAGESGRPSSGGGSTAAAGTAPTVDPED
jgi:hypothetical protein